MTNLSKIKLVITPMSGSVVYTNKGKPKAKAKAKAKTQTAKPKAAPKANNKKQRVDLPTENFDPNVQCSVIDEDGSVTETLRDKTWMDNLFECLGAAMQGVPQEGLQKLKSVYVSVGLEFCWRGFIMLDGKKYSTWSSLRDKLRNMIADESEGPR